MLAAMASQFETRDTDPTSVTSRAEQRKKKPAHLAGKTGLWANLMPPQGERPDGIVPPSWSRRPVPTHHDQHCYGLSHGTVVDGCPRV